jgi:tetratricopeptide (TPR) repeat protein
VAILSGEEDLLFRADEAFLAASTLVDEKAAPAEFYWHWGIVWSVIAKQSGEAGDLQKAIAHFAKARALGCSRPDFFNDYANIIVELGLAISSDDLILEAVSLYQAAIDATTASSEKGVHFFNLGCCCQHLFEATSEKEFFAKAHQAFETTAALNKDSFAAWLRQGFLLFRAWRIWKKPSLVKEAVAAFRRAKECGVMSAVDLGVAAQAFLWHGISCGDEEMLKQAYEYAQNAFSLKSCSEPNPEPFVALALCYVERGKCFGEISYIEKALSLLQEGIGLFPRSAVLWQAIATTKWTQADMLVDSSVLRDALVAYTIASRSFFALSPEFWADWGVALLNQAEFSEDPLFACESIAKFERAFALAQERPVTTLYHMGRAFFFLGDAYDEEEYFDRAIAFLTEALLENETFLPVLYQLASCYLHLGELASDKNAFSMARLYYEQLLTLDPEDELAWIDYALTLVHLGEASREGNCIPQEWFQAEDALCTAQNLGQPFALYQKACLYTLMGNFPEAIEYLYKALKEEELPELQDLLEDEWLEPLTRTCAFQKFLQKVEKTSADKS